MRVIVPTTRHHDKVERALHASGWQYERVDVSGCQRAYYDLLAHLWDEGDDFAIVEHDIVLPAGALDELADCPADWCSLPYLYGGTLTHGLGCVKFTDTLIARNPLAMIQVGVISDPTHPRRHWCRLDAWLQGVVLPGAGEAQHRHATTVTHLGSGAAHDCTHIF